MATAAIEDRPSRKIALVIGNENYADSSNKLPNGIANARDVANQLKQINFQVEAIFDTDRGALKLAWRNLRERIETNDLVFIYYCGKIYNRDGINYLIPVDDKEFHSEIDIADFALQLQDKLVRLAESTNTFAVVAAFDCTTPYLLGEMRKSRNLPEPKGFQSMSLKTKTIVQFGCSPNEISNSTAGQDRNSLYTSALLQHMMSPNVDIRDIFSMIQTEVYKRSSKKQKPYLINVLPETIQVILNHRITVKDFFTDQKLSPIETQYFAECKEYYRLTNQPLISIPGSEHSGTSPTIIKLCIDTNHETLDLYSFIGTFSSNMNLPRESLVIKRIQAGSAVIEIGINEKFIAGKIELKLKAIADSINDKMRDELAKANVFFMFLGSSSVLEKIQKLRSEVTLNPRFNRIYTPGRDHWTGPLNDGRDRGGKPYYCPEGWRRWSFYVTENFDSRFRGCSICYHGTKFAYGLAILLSGFKAANVKVYGDGIYASPSINYVAHPRYSEVKKIDLKRGSKFFKSGKYVQFVLECRVSPRDILCEAPQTLKASKVRIDKNIGNDVIEWLIDNHGQSIVDFTDPNASIVCSGIMVRVTDQHPGLLPESQWWFHSFMMKHPEWCSLDISLTELKQLREQETECKKIFE